MLGKGVRRSQWWLVGIAAASICGGDTAYIRYSICGSNDEASASRGATPAPPPPPGGRQRCWEDTDVAPLQGALAKRLAAVASPSVS